MPVKRGKRNTRKKSKGRSSVLEVRARSTEKRRKRAERLKAISLLTVAAIGLLWLLVIGGRYFVRTLFTGNDSYIVRHLKIETDGRMTPNLIKRFGMFEGIEDGVNLFAIDLGRVREELESVPLIKEVAIRRSLPDTLEVTISERVALAKVAAGADGYEMMVDREGILLGLAGRGQTLPTLSGLRISELKVGRMLQGNLALDALNVLDMCDRTRLKQFVQIENIDISDAETMELRLQTGEYVILPRSDLRSKLVDLANILNTCRRQKRQLAKVDMTVENMAPAVEYR